MKKLKNLENYIFNLFFINLTTIIISFKFLKNFIFYKINVFIKYKLTCQSFLIWFKNFKSFKNLFEKFIGWEIFLDRNSLEIGIDLGDENYFNLDYLILSFATPSQEQEQVQEQIKEKVQVQVQVQEQNSIQKQDKIDVSSSGDNGNENEIYEDEEKVYEENYIPNKSINKEKNQNNTPLEENYTIENYNTEEEDEEISNKNNMEIEEGFVVKLKRNFGFDNLASLWDPTSYTNKNSSSSSSSNNENNTNDSNANANSSYNSNSNNNENNISSSTNTNNNNYNGRFYIDEENDSDFGDFGD